MLWLVMELPVKKLLLLLLLQRLPHRDQRVE
jgi:hypothetical protein